LPLCLVAIHCGVLPLAEVDGGSSLANMPFEMFILRTALARVADESAQ
jgi:hypothetical protein